MSSALPSAGRKREAPHVYRGYKRAKDGLLSHRKIPVAQQEICDRNAHKSPFLRLPVEIRERIYELVIGGHHVQIEYKPHEHRRRQKNGVKYHEHIVGGFWHFCATNESPMSRPFGDPCEGARFKWSARFSTEQKVTLLATVCRQLHQETSLLIYELNLFSFNNRWVMRKWLETLKPLQKRSIRRICLPSPDEALTKTHRKQLSGLNEVFFYNGATKRVRCKVCGSSGVPKYMSVPKARGWAKVEDDSVSD